MNRTRRWTRLVLVWCAASLGLLALLTCLQQPAAAFQASPADGVRVLRSDTGGVVLELSVGSYQLETRAIGGGEVYAALSAAHLTPWSERPGAPQLPMRGVMVGVPQDANVTLRVLTAEAQEFALPHPLLPAPFARVERELPPGMPRTDGQSPQRDAPSYARQGFAPEASAQLGTPGYLRSQRFAQVSLFPFQYDAAAGRVRWTKRLVVELQFAYAQGSPAAPGAARAEGPFEDVLRAQLANYESARGWRQPPAAGAARVSAPASAGGDYRIAVREQGIYRLSYADLTGAGVPSNVDPRTLKVFKNGSEVPVSVVGEGDGVLDPSDYAEFYAQSINTAYSDVNIYWLSHGGANGLRMGTRAVPPAGGSAPAAFSETLHVEQNGLYISTIPWGNGDHWYWMQIYTATGATANPPFTQLPPTAFTFTVKSPTSAQTATLRTQVVGFGSAFMPHHATVSLNGHAVADDTWTGLDPHTIAGDFSGSYLISGTNTISISLPNDSGWTVDGILLRAFDLDYQRAFIADAGYLEFAPPLSGSVAITVNGFPAANLSLYAVTSAGAPVRLTGFAVGGTQLSFSDVATASTRYVALANGKPPLSVVRDQSPSNLRSTANGADYIAIVYDDFYTATAPLVDLRAAQGMRAMRVRISDIYDEFSDGVFDATAIRSFLTYAYQAWQSPAPQWVVLVGDGNTNYHNFNPASIGPVEPNYIPPFMDASDQFINEVAVDNRYVNVAGSDIVPDMAIGRLPVRSVSETQRAVAKIVAYESAPPPGAWRTRVGFFTDSYYNAVGTPDAAGNFYATSDAIAAHISPTFSVTKAYFDLYLPSATSPWYYTTEQSTRYAITSTLSDGLLFANYVGHGAPGRWGKYGELLTSDADLAIGTPDYLATVIPGPRQPIVLELTCYTGAFNRPGLNTLAESFVRMDGGAIADWASTGAGINFGHEQLAQAFYDAFFQNGVRRLGLAANYAKAQMYASASHLDLIDEFTLFGDPALLVFPSIGQKTYLPLIVR